MLPLATVNITVPDAIVAADPVTDVVAHLLENMPFIEPRRLGILALTPELTMNIRVELSDVAASIIGFSLLILNIYLLSASSSIVFESAGIFIK